MKPKLLMFMLMASIQAMSQSINSGNYVGDCVISLLPNQKIPSTMSLTVTGNNVKGTMKVNANGNEVTYQLNARLNDKVYEGKISEESGELDLKLVNLSTLNPSKKGIYFEAFHLGMLMLSGEFQKSNGTSPTPPKTAIAQKPSKPVIGAANLPRDTRLVGVWERVRFSRVGVNNQKRIGFYEDGRMEVVTKTSAVTYSGGYGTSFDEEWQQDAGVQNTMNAGGRWFTKNGILYIKLADGREIPNTYYFVENGGDGKINLFFQNTPNQKKPDEMFRKIR
jgi:hypothetical protein